MKVNHTLKPIYNANSKILILGTMPSVKSREKNFYYAHPRNRFWWTLEQVLEEPIGETTEERTTFLLNHNIALFDVLKSCEIEFSNDQSIKNPIPNDINKLIKESKIDTIFTTGKKAYELYNKLILPKTHIEAILLPSPSPANCPKGIEEKLIKEYQQILKSLE